MVDTGPVYVVVVDSSPATRELLVAALESTPGIHVLGTGADGEEALRLVKRLNPTVAIFDARLPKLDTVEVTRRIMREMPTRIVILSDETVDGNTDQSFEALRAGALTVVGRPESSDRQTYADLVRTVQLMAGVPVVHHWGRREARTTPESLAGARAVMRATIGIKIVGIATSTGGPTALATVLGALPASFPLPILVVQHIAPGFASGLVQWLATRTTLAVRLAAHGERPTPGVVLVAPDDHHMQVSAAGVVELTCGAPYKGLRPSANPLFLSLAHVFGPAAMGIILTGMGDDGVDGLEALHRKGGPVIAQDESTSVVYGMPQQAVRRGVVDDVLSLPLIALALAEWRNREKVGMR